MIIAMGYSVSESWLSKLKNCVIAFTAILSQKPVKNSRKDTCSTASSLLAVSGDQLQISDIIKHFKFGKHKKDFTAISKSKYQDVGTKFWPN